MTKQPLSTPYYSLEQQFGSFNWYRTAIDATGPLTADNTFDYRLNFAYQTNDSFREFGDHERIFVAPALRWNIGPRTYTTLQVEYSNISDTGLNYIPAIGNRPASVSRKRQLGEPWGIIKEEYVLVSLDTEHELNSNWTLHHRFNASFAHLTMSDLGPYSPAAPNGDVDRFFFAQNLDGGDYQNNYFTSLNFIGKLKTGELKHTLLLGGDYLYNEYRSTNAWIDSPDFATNVFRPVHVPRPNVPAARINTAEVVQPWFGLYLQDQVELPFHLHVLAGLRYDQAYGDNYHTPGSTGITTHTNKPTDSAITPRGGLLWRPIPELSLYGSYTENFGASNGLDPDGKSLNPQSAQQWEVGMKTELWNGRLATTFSYFELTKQNLPVPALAGLGRMITIGEAETRGIEFDIAGEILPGWNVIANYAYLPFAKITKDTQPERVGIRLHNAPRHNANLWTTFQFRGNKLNGLKLGAGIEVLSQREAFRNHNAAFSPKAPGYSIVNLMASYPFNIGRYRITTQLNVRNLLDKSYIANTDGWGGVMFGTPRMFLGSLRVEY